MGEGLSPEQVEDFQARAKSQLSINEDSGDRIVRATSEYSVTEVAKDENARYSAYEKAKSGDMSGFIDDLTSERQYFGDTFALHGLEGVAELADKKMKEISEGPLDIPAVATKVAEVQLGTDARGTDKLNEAIDVTQDALETKYRG